METYLKAKYMSTIWIAERWFYGGDCIQLAGFGFQ